jgi:hypothetical protein
VVTGLLSGDRLRQPKRATRTKDWVLGLFGRVTAGRDTGNSRFEIAALAELVRFAIGALTAAGLRQPTVALTRLSERGERIAAAVAGTEAGIDRARTAGAVITGACVSRSAP